MNMADIKVVTQENLVYIFKVNHAKLRVLTVMEDGVEKSYYLDSQNEENRITKALLHVALEELLRAKPLGFDVVTLCLIQEGLDEIALEVYKKVMDEFYNMGIAEVAFKRNADSIDKAVNTKHTLFEED